jgi:hypothetical protein
MNSSCMYKRPYFINFYSIQNCILHGSKLVTHCCLALKTNLVAKNSSGRKSFNQRHIQRDWRLSMTACPAGWAMETNELK